MSNVESYWTSHASCCSSWARWTACQVRITRRVVILVCVQCRELLDVARKQLLIMGEVDGMSGSFYEKVVVLVCVQCREVLDIARKQLLLD